MAAGTAWTNWTNAALVMIYAPASSGNRLSGPHLPVRRPAESFAVRNLICFGEKPAPLPDGVVEEIAARENAERLICDILQFA